MDYDSDCYLDKSKKYDRFIPETDIKFIKYDDRLWNRKFWLKPKNNFSKLQLTNIGIYSIAQKETCQIIPNIIKKYLNINDVVITETTGGLGGLSLCLVDKCKKLNIVEITPTHSQVIRNNLEVYEFDKNKYNIINDDYMNVMMDLEQDVIIADVPWGGYAYRLSNSLNLGLNNINIVCIINKLIKLNKFKLFIYMIPYNYDKNYFIEHIDKSVRYTIETIHNTKHYIITVINK